MNAFKQILVPNGQQPAPADDMPWWLTTLTKGVGGAAGLIGIFCGVITMLSISLTCIFAGAVIAVEGLIITLVEAPCFCVFLDFSQIPARFFDTKPHWVRATVYLFFAGFPFILCSGIASFFGCGMYLITSALYLMQSLGRKASFDQMRQSAGQVSTAPTAVLVANELPVATTKGQFGGSADSGLTGVVY
jgi:hypothetical protein